MFQFWFAFAIVIIMVTRLYDPALDAACEDQPSFRLINVDMHDCDKSCNCI